MTGGLGAWLVMKYGSKIGINDIPNERSSHKIIVPKGGGIGILIAFIGCSFFLNLSANFWIPCCVISLMSLWGDRYEIPPAIRLFIHFGCSWFFLLGFCFLNKPLLPSGLLSIPLSFFLAGTANFYNFMDGIDGIAGIAGIIGFLLLALYSWLFGNFEIYGMLCIGIALSCFGFLFFNLTREKKVFMGDVGSILLGFVFSCIVLILSENFLDFLIMAGFLFPFYFDELFTMVIRLRCGDALVKPHRKHIYQVLANELSVSHWKIALSYGIIQLCIGFTAIHGRSLGLVYLISLYMIYCFIFVRISIKIHKRVIVQ